MVRIETIRKEAADEDMCCLFLSVMVCGIIKWKDINFFENLFSEDVGSALFGGQFSGDFMSPDNTSDGWLRKKWVIQNQRRVLLKSGSGESQQEPLNEVLANMICDRLDIKNYVKYQCGYQEDQSPFILSTLQEMLSGDGS